MSNARRSSLPASTNAFHWHPAARLFAGPEEIQTPAQPGPGDFCLIPPQPTPEALVALAQQIRAGGSFALADHLSDAQDIPAGHLITFTGGSTGTPKPLLRSQNSWRASFVTNAQLFQLTPDDGVAVLGNLSHSLALYAVIEGLCLGLDVHVLDGLRPRAQGAEIRKRRISVLYATPTQLRLLAASGTRMEALRVILCGGGLFDQATRAATQAMAPTAKIYEFYGAAETSFVTLSGPDTPVGSVGRAYPDVTLRILDHAGQPTDGTGEVWVRSPYLAQGYLDGGLKNLRSRDGFVSVGELGRLDKAGHLWLEGRLSRAVNIADQLVCPETVESFVARLPGALVCTVLSRPDALRGHHLILVVKGPANANLTASIMAACRARFGPLIAPKQVIFQDAFPRLPSGKTDLIALAQQVGDAR